MSVPKEVTKHKHTISDESQKLNTTNDNTAVYTKKMNDSQMLNETHKGLCLISI